MKGVNLPQLSSLPPAAQGSVQQQAQAQAQVQQARDADPATAGTPHEQKQTPEQQAATARRLKPHNKSQIGLDKAARERESKPEGMTPVANTTPHKKPRQTKWQFGIRSRNQPAEAMLAIYKALAAMGAEWEVPDIRQPRSVMEGASAGEDLSSISGSEYSTSPSDDEEAIKGTSPRGRRRPERSQRFSASNDWGYDVPHDPWIINARFRKDGLYAPGVHHPNSAHSSRIDLRGSTDNMPLSRGGSKESVLTAGHASATGLNDKATGSGGESRSRRGSNLGGVTNFVESPHDTTALTALSPTHPTAVTTTNSSSGSNSRPGSRRTPATGSGTTSSQHTTDSHGHRVPRADDSVYVYVTIQLYSIEKEFYLVDFKCAGYEHLHLRHVVRDVVGEAFGRAAVSQLQEGTAPVAVPGSGGMSAGTMGTGMSAGRGGTEEYGHGFHHGYHGIAHAAHGGGNEGAAAAVKMMAPMGKEELRELVGDGRAAEEKDVSSPFPFLDVASRLIIQLAEAE